MRDSELLPRTIVAFYRVVDRDGPYVYQAVYLRSWYHGARPGEEVTPQVEYVGNVCRLDPGRSLDRVLEIRDPRTSEAEVEQEAVRFLAEHHGVGVADIEETARHVFDGVTTRV